MPTAIDSIRLEATKKLDQSKRGELGQFMTPSAIAKFMAGLFDKNNLKTINLLDAGAGIGSLSIAFIERLLSNAKKVKNLNVVAYEIDKILSPYLKNNLDAHAAILAKSSINLEAAINQQDFIVDAVSQIENCTSLSYTHAILNPPYKKIHSTSSHRQLLSSIGFETVNLYSAFVALSLLLLKDKGELVAIIPRSFCNGNYYKAFRNLITKYTAIKQIHLFDSRNHAFKDDDVLQENIIIHLQKGVQQGDVIISRSTNESFIDFNESIYPFEQIVKPKDSEYFIRIPSINTDHIENSEEIVYSLQDIGVEVSTGPVVDFRSRDHISMQPNKNSVPLIYPSHFNCKEIDWPKDGKKPNAITLNQHTQKMLYPSGFYTIVKRFSSKEEKQRVVARVINPNHIDGNFIGFENHLNVFHSGKKGIAEYLAYGIAAYLNSSYVDTHFRSFNGHTQVNATDLKQIKYPNRDLLIKLGRWSQKLKTFDQEKIDHQIKSIL